MYTSVSTLRHEGELSRSVNNQKANGGVGRYDVIAIPGWEQEPFTRNLANNSDVMKAVGNVLDMCQKLGAGGGPTSH